MTFEKNDDFLTDFRFQSESPSTGKSEAQKRGIAGRAKTVVYLTNHLQSPVHATIREPKTKANPLRRKTGGFAYEAGFHF